MSLFPGPVLAMALGLLYLINPFGLGDAAFRQLNKYPRIDWSAEAARRQAFSLGRAMFGIGAGWAVWVLLLEADAGYPVKAAFLAVAAPSAFALVLFTIVDTITRAITERGRKRT